MKKIYQIVFLSIICLSLGTECFALTHLGYDFAVNGVFYKITDADKRTVAVSWEKEVEGYASDDFYSGYHGDVVIPASVTYGSTTYSVTSIASWAFYDDGYSSITSISLPSSIVSIGSHAFSCCDRLTTITIPPSVSYIGNYAFGGCTGLGSIYINWNLSSIPSISSDVFSSTTYSNAILYAHPLALSKLQTLVGWGSFVSVRSIYSNYLYTTDARMKMAEKTSVLPVYIDNNSTICGFDFSLILPEHVSVKYVYDEDEEKYIYGIQNGERARTNHITKCTKKDDGSYYIFCYSPDNENFYETEEKRGLPVLYITLVGDETLTRGEFEILLKDIILNHNNEEGPITEYKIDEMASLLTVPFERNVTFTVDGTVYSSGMQTAGDILQVPTNPTKTGYTFNGWKNVTSTTVVPDYNVTYEAVFSVNQYTITFVVEGRTYSTTKQTYGTTLWKPTNPTKTGYTFMGWNGLAEGATVPASDMTYTAVFTINHYTVTFIADGNVIYQEQQEWGSPIVPPTAPTKAKYVFISWGNVDATVPLRNVTYTAQYALVGDVFGDDKVNISDLTTLVNILVNKLATDERTFKAADINADTRLNITDLTSLVNIMASSNRGNATSRRTSDSPKANMLVENNILFIDRDNCIHLSLDNRDVPIANLQFDLVLPYGVRLGNGNNAESVITSSRTSNHSVSLSEQEDGSIRFFLYTFLNETIVGNEGYILDIIVNVKGLEREEELIVKNVVMNDTEGTEICIDEIRKQITLHNTTGITSIETENDGSVWGVQGIRYETPVQGINIINGRKKITK